MMTFKVDFVGGAVRETVTGSAPKVIIDSITATLDSAVQKSDDVVKLAAGAVDVDLFPAHMPAAGCVLLVPDGPISIKVSGGLAQPVDSFYSVFGTVSGIRATNPSSTDSRSIRRYIASIS